MAQSRSDSFPAFSRLAVVAAFSLTLGFFGPARIHLGNGDEFAYGFASLLPFLAALVLALALAGLLVLKALPPAAGEKLLALLLAFAGLLWLQGSILAWNYGLLDGRDIDWSRKLLYGLIDTPVWALLLLLAFVRSSSLRKAARVLALALIVVQALDLLAVVLPNSPKAGSRRYGIDESRRFSFSGRRNVIILVLDTFQSDVFQEILNEDPRQAGIFSGFTYFRNSLSGSPSTRSAIPEILTSRQYDNSVPMAEFLEKAYLGGSLPLLLKENGFRCDIFPPGNVPMGLHLDPALASNLKDRFPPTLRDVAFLADLSLFRQAPHFAKIGICNGQSWFLSRMLSGSEPDGRSFRRAARKMRSTLLPDQVFAAALAREARADSPQPVFKYYHLRGIHPPLRMNELCRLERMEFNRRNYRRQAVGLLRLVAAMLARLKEIGVFRGSLIFIIGDHGPGNWGLREIHLDALGTSPPEASRDPALLNIKAGALPLMLVKPLDDPGARQLAVSDAPVCNGDIPATVAAALGLPAGFSGRPLFAVAATEDRVRRHLHYEGFGDNQKGFLEPMSEYRVRGFSWLDGAWQATGNSFPPGGKLGAAGAGTVRDE